jgi:hypothetical protein
VTRWVVVGTFAPTSADADKDRVIAGLNALAAGTAGITASTAGCHLPGSAGDGDFTWDVTTSHGLDDLLTLPPTAAILDRSAGAVAAIDAVALATIAARTLETPAPFVKRTLLLRVRPGTDPASVHGLEGALAGMPDHIDAIRSWALSRVDQARHPSRWTHVWEQEFARLEGLQHDYMVHPYHWTRVDAWFDPEMPTMIVTDLAHLFHQSLAPVLRAGD